MNMTGFFFVRFGFMRENGVGGSGCESGCGPAKGKAQERGRGGKIRFGRDRFIGDANDMNRIRK